MAKGTAGNLLQHFVALHAARCLNAEAGAFEYVDLFAMAPWEPAEKPEREYVALLDSFAARPEDEVASAFLKAWAERYGATLPARSRDREYPNTATLLLHAKAQLSGMILCEHDEGSWSALRAYLAEHAKKISHEVYGSWQRAPLGAAEGPTMVMLDPFQVHLTRTGATKPEGYLTVADVRGILGATKLDVLGRAIDPKAAPVIATIFSSGDRNAEATDRELRRDLEKYGWQVSGIRVKTATTKTRKIEAWHQAWWCASHDSVAGPEDLQREWDTWSAMAFASGKEDAPPGERAPAGERAPRS